MILQVGKRGDLQEWSLSGWEYSLWRPFGFGLQ